MGYSTPKLVSNIERILSNPPIKSSKNLKFNSVVYGLTMAHVLGRSLSIKIMFGAMILYMIIHMMGG